MRELDDRLEQATAAITWGFFRVAIAEGNPIFRERVYTYELYHQLRKIWPENSPYTLNGELDKSGHPLLRDILSSSVKPDLLIHQPGSMHGNFAIIEIKPANAGAAGIKKDIETLSEFIRKVDYRRAIYLVYGDEISDRLVNRISTAAQEYARGVPIELWLHTQPNKPAYLAKVIGRPVKTSSVVSRD